MMPSSTTCTGGNQQRTTNEDNDDPVFFIFFRHIEDAGVNVFVFKTVKSTLHETVEWATRLGGTLVPGRTDDADFNYVLDFLGRVSNHSWVSSESNTGYGHEINLFNDTGHGYGVAVIPGKEEEKKQMLCVIRTTLSNLESTIDRVVRIENLPQAIEKEMKRRAQVYREIVKRPGTPFYNAVTDGFRQGKILRETFIISVDGEELQLLKVGEKLDD